ncbi:MULTISPECIES: alpha/beta fold hydrolase [unclassified Crossiella]|uniref:alpha/beta fold hydrolase n=1 Tax=unclassified Crossiella TaxID=2620835 RepID=UPI001FFF69BC|nr:MULTISPECIES: alpha/beta hydrolase [unclassified Crossiella]MCK2239156.1 alpha/beta hydrolase [Crossiella sp. S99.2]MCK2251275.1 alpha/beta hydrolase [Crossiella sp. S99.1]
MIYRSEAGQRRLRELYLAELASWPVPHDQRRVPTPEGETFVLSCGPLDAPPLVLLHGSGSNSAQWLGRIPELATFFRVHAVDIIGEPGLSAPTRPDPASDRHTRWLDAVLDHLGLARTAMLGYSLGSWLALDYATRRPERVDRLALSCPPGITKERKGYLVKALLLAPFGRWGKLRTVRMMLGPGLSTVDESAVVARTVLMSRHYRYRSGDLPVFTDEALGRLTMPVHVLLGELDVMWDTRIAARRLRTVLPRATVRLLPGTGHLVPTEEAELEFLTTTTAGRRHA